MRTILRIIFFLISITVSAQKQSWKDYFSYTNIMKLSAGTTQVYGATENAVVVYNTKTSLVETLTSVDGLKVQNVSALHYSEKFNKLFIGNQDGSIQVINISSGKIYFIDDILNKNSLPPGSKQINSFTEYKGVLYLATNYGISVINLNNNEFLDTYFVGHQGGNEIVNQVAVLDQSIYAATANRGLLKADITQSNLVDYKVWEEFDPNMYLHIETIQGVLVGVQENGQFFKIGLGSQTPLGDFEGIFQSLIQTKSHIVISTDQQARIYSLNFELIGSIQRSSIKSALFLNNHLYVGTQDQGLLQYKWPNLSSPKNLSPKGPLSNKVFSLLDTELGMWFVFGGFSDSYNPHNPGLGTFGLSRYNYSKGWEQVPYSLLKEAKALSKASLNPRDKNQLFVSSFHSGLVQVDLNQNDLARSKVTLYNSQNTGINGLEKLNPIVHNVASDYVSVRINGPAFDREGTLWVTNSMVYNTLKNKSTDGTWRSYSFANRLQDVEMSSFQSPLIDNQNTKWIPSYKDGLIGFNELKSAKVVLINSSSGQLPDNNVRTIALDKNNQLWIGTYKGLRILSNPEQVIQQGQMHVNPVIISEDGLAEELFYQQNISKIFVDGANNKWVAVADAGVFMLSANGQQTLYHFTKDNSPLPSNTVNDIAINQKTGEVLFATDAGVVSFLGSATEGSSSYAEIMVYPNPVRPGFLGDVKITGLIDKSVVKIADVQGNLVFETTSNGGTVTWDTYSFSGTKVRSGVYMIFISSPDAQQSQVKKLMIIR